MPNLVPVSLSLWAGIYQVLFAFRLGAPVVLMERFEPVEFARLVARVRHPFVGVAARRDGDAARATPRSRRSSRCATCAACRRRSRRSHARHFHERFGVAILNGYGQTELGGEVVGWTARRLEGVRRRPSSARSAVRTRGSRCGCADDELAGAIGELVRAAPLPTRTALGDRVTDDGWLRTGDLAPHRRRRVRVDRRPGERDGQSRRAQGVPRRGGGAPPRASRRSPTPRSPACPMIASAKCRGRSWCVEPDAAIDADARARVVPRRAWRRTRCRPA